MKNHSIVLRKPLLSDAEALLKISQDRAVMELYGDAPYKSIEHAQDILQWCIDHFGQESHRWIIAHRETNAYIGEIEFYDYVADHRRIQLGFRLVSDYWNRGIMTEALEQALRYAFKNFSYNRVEALVDTANNACKGLLQKCGFTLEGCLRQYEYEENGPVDLNIFSILMHEVHCLGN